MNYSVDRVQWDTRGWRPLRTRAITGGSDLWRTTPGLDTASDAELGDPLKPV